jgi:hypothetical protein
MPHTQGLGFRLSEQAKKDCSWVQEEKAKSQRNELKDEQ